MVNKRLAQQANPRTGREDAAAAPAPKGKTARKLAAGSLLPQDFHPTAEDVRDAAPRAKRIFALLGKEYPAACCTLDHANALELLIATILAAQCTDARVNLVTKYLFRKYRTPAAYAAADPAELEQDVKSTGFFRNKTKSIQAACRDIIGKFSGQVPRTMDKLLTLAGVGRKTANVILGSVFDTPGIITDTHVIRLSRLMGLSTQEDPVKLELDLQQLLPRKDWTLFCHRLVFHGRGVCLARRPDCDHCVVRPCCCYGRRTAAP